MFCPDCGHELQEGHAFCKYCGARLDDADSSPTLVASPPPAVPADAAPPPAPFADTAPQPSPPADTTPPAPPPLDVTPVAAAGPPPSNNKRVLLIIAAVVLGLLVFTAAAAALFVPTRSDTDTGDTGSTVAVENVDTTGTGTTGTATTGTTGATDDTTTLTIPSYHPSDNPGTVPVTDPGGGTAPDSYLESLDRLDGVLYDADGKMMAIADKINATTPNIPTSVYEDLMTVGDDVMSSYDWLNAETPPAGYEQAHDLILQAGDAMITRIDKTTQGVLAIDGEGTTDAGLPFFAEAKAASDEFADLYAAYQQARP